MWMSWILLLGLGCRTSQDRAELLSDRDGVPLHIGYVEHLSAGATAEQELPLVVILHGLGDVPESMARVMADYPEPARFVALRGEDPWNNGWSWFPIGGIGGDVSVAAPILEKRADRIAEFAIAYADAHPTSGKPVITGFSQGAMLSYAVAVRHPDVVGRAVPVSGMLPKPLWPEEAAPAGAPSITALHGVVDEIVPLAMDEASVAALKAQGWTIELKTFPGVNHEIPEAVRSAWYAELAAP